MINTAGQLSGTLTNLTQVIDGNVTTNDSAGADGFGTPKLVSVEYNGTTYTFNNSNTSFTIVLVPTRAPSTLKMMVITD